VAFQNLVMGVELGLCGVFVFVDQVAQDGLACDLFVVAVGDGVVCRGGRSW
jgi:hypothetical protein